MHVHNLKRQLIQRMRRCQDRTALQKRNKVEQERTRTATYQRKRALPIRSSILEPNPLHFPSHQALQTLTPSYPHPTLLRLFPSDRYGGPIQITQNRPERGILEVITARVRRRLPTRLRQLRPRASGMSNEERGRMNE